MGANISALDVIKQSLLINGEWVQPAHQRTVKSRKAVIAPPLMKKEGRPIVTEFWNMGSWDERYTYVKTMVKKVKKKQARSESEERDSSYDWNISSTEGEHKQVCRKMFASTLGVSERTFCSWLTKEKQNVVPTVEPIVTNPQTINKPLSEEDKKNSRGMAFSNTNGTLSLLPQAAQL